jgi:hypothetical protein
MGKWGQVYEGQCRKTGKQVRPGCNFYIVHWFSAGHFIF